MLWFTKGKMKIVFHNSEKTYHNMSYEWLLYLIFCQIYFALCTCYFKNEFIRVETDFIYQMLLCISKWLLESRLSLRIFTHKITQLSCRMTCGRVYKLCVKMCIISYLKFIRRFLTLCSCNPTCNRPFFDRLNFLYNDY